MTFVLKLVATDLDGTLLRPDGSISDRTRRVFAQAHAQGVPTALVSARPPRAVREIAAALGLDGLAVCANGAVLYDIGADVILDRVTLDADAVARLAADIRASHPDAVFGAEYGHFVRCEPAFPRTPAFADVAEHCVTSLEEILAEAMVKLMVHHPEHPVEHFTGHVAVRAQGGLAVTHSGDIFAEIAAEGVSKAAGLARLCGRLDIGLSQVAAFGDMPNDIPMLAEAGLAVAVANAHAEVLAIADAVTASNAEDGVAQMLERLLGA